MKEFIVSNLKEIIFLSCFLIEFILSIILLIKKAKKDSGVVGGILSQLPSIINLVEKKFGAGSGSSKKIQAVDLALELYQKMTGISLTYDSKLAQVFSDSIEDILSTPQKKEIS